MARGEGFMRGHRAQIHVLFYFFHGFKDIIHNTSSWLRFIETGKVLLISFISGMHLRGRGRVPKRGCVSTKEEQKEKIKGERARKKKKN